MWMIVLSEIRFKHKNIWSALAGSLPCYCESYYWNDWMLSNSDLPIHVIHVRCMSPQNIHMDIRGIVLLKKDAAYSSLFSTRK